MAQNVIFKIGTRAQFDAIVAKNQNTLYWLRDTQELYKGDILFGKGALASETAAGLLSAEDYKKLQELIATGGTVDLTPVDGSIVIKDKKIGVGLSAVEGNILSIKNDGLFATVDTKPIENRLTAVEGRLDPVEQDIANLKQSIVGSIRYMGSVQTYDDLPDDAKQGDLYEVISDGSEWCFNGNKWFEYGTSHFVPVAGAGIFVNGSEIGVKIADESHGLTIVDGAMAMLLATAKQDGAMSKEDKAKLDAISEVYVAKKFEITDAPAGTLVNYGEKEIRIMCPDGAEYNLQNVGTGGNPNTYYVTFRTYAPSADAVGYMEHLGGKSDVEILKDIKTDKYGRRYQPTWLGVATFDEATGTWNYYGKNSSADKFIGWDYQIDWFDANDVMIASDSIRINLSNEDCHHTIVPSYMADYAESSEIEALKATIEDLEKSYSWGEI
jgi:hypothetical protein